MSKEHHRAVSLEDPGASYAQYVGLRVWIMAHLCDAGLDLGTLSCRVVNLIPLLLSFDEAIRPHAMEVLSLIPRVRSLSFDELTSIIPVYLAIGGMGMPFADASSSELVEAGAPALVRRARKAAP